MNSLTWFHPHHECKYTACLWNMSFFLSIQCIFPLYTCNFSFSSPYFRDNQDRQLLNYKALFDTLDKDFFCFCMVSVINIEYERIDRLNVFCSQGLMGTCEFCNVSAWFDQGLKMLSFWRCVFSCYCWLECCLFTNLLHWAKDDWSFEFQLRN